MRANLSRANLTDADLKGADAREAQLVETNLMGATLIDCQVYGVSAWGVRVSEGTKQQGLIITPTAGAAVSVDDLEVAQFVYLLLHNEKIRRVIDTITSKVVLILGRFSILERMAVLNALRDDLHTRGYVPVVFDFEKASGRTTDEIITLLARMARFVIADISDAKSVLQELRGIVPDNPTLPVQPIIVAEQEEPGMFDFFKRYPWVLEVNRYHDPAHLLGGVGDVRLAGGENLRKRRRRPSARRPSTGVATERRGAEGSQTGAGGLVKLDHPRVRPSLEGSADDDQKGDEMKKPRTSERMRKVSLDKASSAALGLVASSLALIAFSPPAGGFLLAKQT